MGYKKIDKSLDFADFTLASSLKHNCSLKLMEKIDKAFNWSRVESILISHLLLFKCLMLQRWFHINSDPELENQINDRLSFKKFLPLPFSKPAPDHSTCSRFRSRLSKEAMDQINSEILRQFENQGLTINEGVVIDARLVKFASRPISNKEIKKQKKMINTPEGKLDKNGKPLKFSRDMESDWTVKNDKPHCSLKEHASVDVNHGGFILSTTLTPASVNDSNFLPYCTLYSRHTKQPLERSMLIKAILENLTGNFFP